MQLGRRLRQLREERGLTLAEVADAAGISISHLSAIENGTRPNPSFLVVAKLARTYGVPIDSFLDSDALPNAQATADADVSLDMSASYAEMAKRLAEADALDNPAVLLEVLAAYLREREQQYQSDPDTDADGAESDRNAQRPDR
ncbi:helix-turn-helix protein [Alicyclobacillus sacchari]|uniref:Helix-turn-helix protein n=1 Tax=Alicyclobacillus sacchari TaxID=392010 RepID=A0A4V3HF38_9BACL|nr:helix-turn-helix domain-containing protein [Alicyclobacillus sacchari]TDY51331.1 helix-turn-helix protein [Alicyclobacillus sacchari]GMA56635.1 hypothetical protein GCM10025858_11380 [Alicyclobacillus sacchari]